MHRINLLSLPLIGFFALAACNPLADFTANAKEAEALIERFQAHHSRADLDAMYAMTSEAFREETQRGQFDEFADIVAKRLGPVEASEQVGFNVNAGTAGTSTIVTMQTTFEQGEGTETYTFTGSGTDMRLQGWQVNSDRLMVSAEDLEALENTP